MWNALEIHPDFTYKTLFQYIGKNKVLPDKINAIPDDSPQLMQLRKAIEKPDFSAPIFSDIDCDIYLLKLLKDNQITASTFLCVYNYLMVCMQYGDQLVKPQDQPFKVKLKHKPTMVPLFAGENVRDIFSWQISSTARWISGNSGKEVSNKDMIDYFKILPAAEQYLICFEFDKDENELKENLELPSNTWFVISKDNKKYYFNITITEYFKKLLNENPVKLVPGFGLVGSELMVKFHSQNLHFYPLYNKHVTNNLTSVHDGLFQGIFAVAQHDNYHGFAASLFSQEDRLFLCDSLPKMLTDNELVSIEDLNPLLYGDNSCSDLDPASYNYLMCFLEQSPDKRLIEFLSNIFLVFILKKIVNPEQSHNQIVTVDKENHSYRVAINLIKLFVDSSFSKGNEKRDIFKDTLNKVVMDINQLPFAREEDRQDILKYYNEKNKKLRSSGLFERTKEQHDVEEKREPNLGP